MRSALAAPVVALISASRANARGVTLGGRVSVRVIGEVRKGDRLVSAGNGLARAASEDEITPYNVIGRALDDKYNREQGTVEAVVRINS